MQKNISQSNDSYVANAHIQKPTIQAKSKVMPSRQSSKSPIQAKQRPIQAKQGKLPPIQTRQSHLPPIQAKKGFVNELKSMTKNASSEEAKTGTSTSLPDPMKTNMEQMGGVDLSDVKVFPNSEKPVQLKAEAYAQGNEIHLSNGQHLGHEAWHVVQQKQGRVTPTIQANNGAQINADPALEKEADDMGAKATQMKPVGSDSTNQSPAQLKTNVVQLKGKNISGDVFDGDFYGPYSEEIDYIIYELSEYEKAGDDDFFEQLSLINAMKMLVDTKIKSGENKDINQQMYNKLLAEETLVKQQMEESKEKQQMNDKQGMDATKEDSLASSLMDKKITQKPSAPKLSAAKSESHDNDKQSNSKTDTSAKPMIGNNNGNQVMEKAVNDNHLNIENEPKVSASGYKQAIMNHRADRDFLKKFIEDGLKSGNRMFRNTCEWIKEEGVELFAITPTHDSGKRGGGQCAYFPDGYHGGSINSSATAYSEDIENNENVGFTDHGTLAWALKNQMFVLNASSADKEKLMATLTHEVQHLADKHDSPEDPQMKNINKLKREKIALDSLILDSETEKSKYHQALEDYKKVNKIYGVELSEVLTRKQFDKENSTYKEVLKAYQEATTNGESVNLMDLWNEKENNLRGQSTLMNRQQKAQKALKSYKTEFRAYNYELYSPHTDVKNQVLSEYDDQIGESYEANELLYNSDLTFQQAVEAYKNPDTEGFNKYNSIRINSFFQALQKCSKEHNANNEEFIALAGTIDKMKQEDVMYILTEGVALRNMVRARLGAFEAKLIFEALQRKTKFRGIVLR
ncbi:hypothetical protein BKI52_17265 [marine bacterium AO1-C]|nr:hypothetical protein BKI52_17265 [marine bacterium AO1-C]